MIEKLQREQALLAWINKDTPFSAKTLQIVSGDASFRRYFRFVDEHSHTPIIAVDAPPPNEDAQRFADVAKAYSLCGVPVPEVLGIERSQGFYCLQDMGDGLFAQLLSVDNKQAMYRQALDVLPAIQQCQQVNNVSLPAYDEQLLDAEAYLFTHWLLEVHLKMHVTDAQKLMIEHTYANLKQTFYEQPQVGVHRDYHSRNLMIKNDALGVIDFQDAVIGPITYDAVSLLRDCYQNLEESFISEQILYLNKTYFPDVDEDRFTKWFDLTGVQRHIKASGIFCRLCHRDQKPAYLNDVPHTLGYIIKVAAKYSETQVLGKFVEEVVLPKMLESLP